MSLLKNWNNSLIPTLSKMNSIFDESLFDFNSDLSLPAVNVKETENHFELEVAVPGYKKDDLEIKIQNDHLKIIAETEQEDIQDEENYTRKEFSKSSFNRSFFLPKDIDQNNINAEFEDGLLKVSLPKHYSPVKESSKFIEIQ